MKPFATLANCAWAAASLPAWSRFRRALLTPAEIQQRLLLRLLRAHAGAAYGRQHGFAKIRSVAEFQASVPIVDYAQLEPWIDRIRRGEQNVLTRDRVTRLLPTSGSTGGRKLIPFTAAFQAQLNAAIGPWMVELFRRRPSVLLGPAYWSISPAIPPGAREESAVPIGFDDDSAYLGGLKQRLVEAALAVPSCLSRVADLESSRYLTLLALLRQPDLRLISVWHPSFLTLLLGALPGWWDELLHDLEHGTCRRTHALPPAIRQVFTAPPQPKRARALRQANPEDPQALWPHLRVVSCWADGQATLAAADLRRRLPHAELQGKGLLATEAFVSIPFGTKHPLAITSHFFEFADPRGDILQAHELRPGETYSVIVTTAGGLWRYRLGDLVEVDGFLASTPSVRFLGRGAGVSDLCGEKLAEPFVNSALAAACSLSGSTPSFAMLAPETEAAEPPNYTLFIEGTTTPALALHLETELRKNPHYALCLDLGQLAPLRCFQIANSAYETFCSASLREGRRLGDIKPQGLSTRTDWRSLFAQSASTPATTKSSALS